MFATLPDAIDAMSSTERGFHFTSNGTESTFLDYRRLKERVHSLARKLTALGNQRGEPVVIVLPEQVEFVQAFLAVVRAGLTVVPVYPPSLTGNFSNYLSDVERIVRITGAKQILTSDGLRARFQQSCTVTRICAWSELIACKEQGQLANLQGSDTALIQFTSGSTGSPKGVELTHSTLIANGMAIQRALEVDPVRDTGVSWLPLHHDMGLIGFLLTPLLVQASTWFLPPLEFARRPHRWLDLMHETQATISYAPNFGYELVTRRVKDADIEDLNLSSWRVAGCGGEAITAAALERFAERLEPAGFAESAFVPSYGLAEATVAVSISPLRRGVICSRQACTVDKAHDIVCSGESVCDTDIRIVSSSGEVMADGFEGEIQVRGPGVAKRFWGEEGHSSATNSDGWLSTGDLGVLKAGELHVLGRIKETLQLNGRNYYPHDIEESVQHIEGVKQGSVVAFARPGRGSEQLVLVAESRSGNDRHSLRRNLRASVRQRLGLSVADIVIVGRGVISRTTSGKIRRNALREKYLSQKSI